MTDAAAGGQAALQLQQSMAAAPYVQEQTDAAAEQTQLKLQQDRLKLEQDRLKASYAPEALALQAQQDQQTLEKTRLSNLVTDTNFKSSEASKASLKVLSDSAEFKAASDPEKLRMAAMLDAQSGNVENLKTNLAAAELLESRQIAVKQKQLDQQAQEVGNAYGVIAALPDDRVQEFVDRLPEANKKALVSQIGEANWSNMTGAEKKEAAKNLMLNAKGQMATQLKNIEVEKAKVLAASRERIEVIRQNGLLNRRMVGSDSNTADDKENRLAWSAYTRAVEGLEKSAKKPLEALDKKVSDAEAKLDKTWFFDAAEKAEYQKAVTERDNFKRDQIKKEITLNSTAPDFPGKQSILDNLRKELELYGEETPAKATPINIEDKSAGKVAEGKVPPSAKGGMPTNAKTHDGYPAKKNADGSYSTELTITVTNPKLNGGKPTNIPSLWKGVEVNEETAVENAMRSGAKYQSFSTIPEAVSAAKEKSKGGGAAATSNNQPVKLTQAESNALIDEANKALKKGAPREKVLERLRAAGVNVKE
jgi:hypothetical protein